MGLAPAFRRSVALLAATALLSSGAVAAGAFSGVAYADEPLTVSPVQLTNNEAGANPLSNLTLSTTGQPFDPQLSNEAVTLVLRSNRQVVLSAQTLSGIPAPTGTNQGKIMAVTAGVDLHLAAPGAYDVFVADKAERATGGQYVYAAPSGFTVAAFTPSVTGMARFDGTPPAAATFRINGANFARNLDVTFETGPSTAKVVDSGVVFSYVQDASANPQTTNPTSSAVKGSLAIARTALGGTYDIVVTNTDNKRGVCAACLVIPKVADVVATDAPLRPAALGLGATRTFTITGAGFFSGTVAKFHRAGAYNTTGGVSVTSTQVVDSQTLKVVVSAADDDTVTASSVRDLTLTNPDGGYSSLPSALRVSPRPKIDYLDGTGEFEVSPDKQFPGNSSKNVAITITGTGFQPGAVATFAVPDGITVNSFQPSSDGISGVVNVDIAATAPETYRDLVVTNPDGGVSPDFPNVGSCSACVKVDPAVKLTSAAPTSKSTGPSPGVPFTLQLNGSGFKSKGYVTRQIVFPDDPTIQVGPVTIDGANTPTFVRASVTLPANTTPGPKRVFLLDANHSYVKCTTPSGGECFTVDSIAVSTIAPTFATNDAATPVTVSGTGFLPGASFKLERAGQTDLPGTGVVAGSGTLTGSVDLREAPPGAWSVRVSNPDASTGICVNCFTVVGNIPTFTAITPSSLPQGAVQQTVRVTGSEFARGMTIAFAPSNVNAGPIQMVSGTLVNRSTYDFVLTVPSNAPVGARTITLTNADAKASPACTTQACSFMVVSPPTVSQASPASRGAGSPTTSVTFTGTGFATSGGLPTVTFDGTGVTAGPATSVTASTIAVPVTVTAGATVSTRKVTITNPDGGTGSCTCFSVVAAPTVTSITPIAIKRGAPAVSVTVTGTNFGTGPTVNFGPGVIASTPVPSTDGNSFTTNVSADTATSTPRTLRDVMATNPTNTNGASGSCTRCFATIDAPGAPNLTLVARGDSRVDLAWDKPVDDGSSGEFPLSYTVTMTPAVATAGITYQGTTAAVTGLANGTSYSFTVKANNPVGAGSESNALTAKPASRSSVPRSPSAASGDAQATVSWTAPESTGGEPITGYTVTSAPDGRTTQVGGTVTTAVVPGLTNGKAYTFDVFATNAVGDSSRSTASNAVTPMAAKPQAPTGLTANPAPSASVVAVSWTAPPADTLTPVTSYRVHVTKAADGSLVTDVTATSTNVNVTGLVNGTSYEFQVFASTAPSSANPSGGEGPGSAAVRATPYGVPGAVVSLTGSAGNTTADLAWNAPATDGGRPITGYTAVLQPGNIAGTVTGTTAHFTGLSNGTDYTGSVLATNLRGNGAASSTGPLRPATVPTAPRSPAATAGNGEATVTWTAPLSDGGTPITGYTVTSSPAGGTRTVAGDLRTAVVTGLTNGTAYTFTVVATNSKGNSPASAPSNAVTPTGTVSTAPTAPSNVVATAGDASATLTFAAPSSTGGSPVTSYTVTVSPAAGTVAYPTDRTQTGASVSGLTNDVAYTFSVVANNAKGSSAAATSNTVTPRALPSTGATTKVSYNAMPGQLRYGTSVALTGRVVRSDQSIGIGVITILVRDDKGVVRSLGRSRPRSTGDYLFRTLPSFNGTYTVRYDGDAANPVATSVARRTLIAVRISASAPAGAANSPLVVTGGVGPNKAGRTLALYRVLSGGRLQELGRAVVASNSTYRVSVRLPRGSYTLQVGLGATPGNAAGAVRFTTSRT